LMRSISVKLGSPMRNRCSRITCNCHLDFCVTTNHTYKLLWGCWCFERTYRSYRVLTHPHICFCLGARSHPTISWALCSVYSTGICLAR
jgi:hypothetical protein